MQSQPFNIADGIDGSPISYTVIYSDTTTGDVCLEATLPASECERGICRHMPFDRSHSECIPQGNVSVSAYATNLLGDGPVSDPVRIILSELHVQRTIYELYINIAVIIHFKVNMKSPVLPLHQVHLVVSLRPVVQD